MSDKVLPEALIEELLPCPFCGNEHPFLEGPTYARHVTCNNHECQASILSDATDAEAIISWNTRASPSSRVLQDEGVVAWAFCPECGSEEIRYEEGRHKQCANCGQEWFSDIDYTDVCAKNLRRLFAAPPAILPSTIGGSVGVSEERVEAFRRDMARSVGSALNLAFMNSTSEEQRDQALHQITQAAVLNFIHTLSPSIQAQER